MSMKFWTQSWFAGLSAGLLSALLLILTGLDHGEERLYATMMQLADREAGDNVAVVGIDARSADALGAQLTSRAVHARVIEQLSRAEAAMIVHTDFFTRPQTPPGALESAELFRYYEASQLVNKAHFEGLQQVTLNEELTLIGTKLQAVRKAMNLDARLQQALQSAGNVVLALPFVTGEDTAPPLPERLQNLALKHRAPFNSPAQQPPEGRVDNVFSPFAAAADGFGVLATTDSLYRVPLVVRHGQSYLPTLPLVLSARFRHQDLSDTEVGLGIGIRLGSRSIATDRQLRMRTYVYGDNDTPRLPLLSFADVHAGTAALEPLADKIVFIGSLLPGAQDLPRFAAGEFIAPVLQAAHATASLLNNHFTVEPAWGRGLSLLLTALVVVYLAWLLPKLSLRWGSVATPAGGVGLLLVQWGLFSQRLWVPVLLPVLVLIAGYLANLVHHAWQHYRRQALLNSEAVVRSRMEGLAYQGQGRLELAFERFLQCPVDDLIMSLLYNLALDFERKHQRKQAVAVYRYMSNHDPAFRDIEQRMQRLNQGRKTPPTSSATLEDWLTDGSSDLKPTLGRYQLERRLARGSMGGDVFLGKDPKLDRMVALKTLALSEEFEGEELQEATTRFFREAAAAGRLNHPDIIAVYDAGEENDLAYISMEFFKGGDLVPYTQGDNLLPLPLVAELIIRTAEALDYAHQQGVVHRDIKPANILYNRATGNLKLTDFGIARIMDTKKTKTGILLGTPSYMSPEQLAGKPVDGRTDLFSLGVTLYQLVTGELPFNADSMASLMFKIASEPHPDLDQLRPDLPACLRQIIDRLLQKEMADRYASGAALAVAMRECLAYLPTRAEAAL